MKEKKEAPKRGKSSNVLDYNDMTDTVMNDLLVELSETKFWTALLRFHDMRCMLADNVLRSIDPFKNPTETARNQGFLNGSSDVINHVMEEKIKRNNAEKSESSE